MSCLERGEAMRNRLEGSGHPIATAVLVSLITLAGLPARAAAPNGPEALVDGFVAAWNSHDMGAFAGLFTEDADFVNVVGMWWKGRADIRAKHEESHATRFKTTTVTSTGTSVRLLRPDIAVLHASWELNGEVDAAGKPTPPRRGIMQMVAVKQAEGWRIAAAQNTNLMAPPR